MLGTHLKLASIVLVAATGSFVAGAVVTSRLTSPATEGATTTSTITEPGIATRDQAVDVADNKGVSPAIIEGSATPKLNLGSSFSRLIGFQPSSVIEIQGRALGGPPGPPDGGPLPPDGGPPGPPDFIRPGPPAETPPVNPPGSPFIP